MPLPELVRRLVRASSTRPLLAATAAHETPETALFDQLNRTLAARQQFYSQAHLRHAGAATVPAIVAALAKAGFRPDLT